MKTLIVSRVTLIWFGLVAATALSWEMGHGFGFSSLRSAGVAILLVAMIKARFVILEFMELRHAPMAMRLVAEAWVLVLSAVLVTMFLIPTGSS